MTRIIGLQALVGPSSFIQAILIKQLGNLRTNWTVYMALQNSWKWSILIGIAFFNWHKWRYCRQQLRKRSIHALYMMFANAEYPDLSFLHQIRPFCDRLILLIEIPITRNRVQDGFLLKSSSIGFQILNVHAIISASTLQGAKNGLWRTKAKVFWLTIIKLHHDKTLFNYQREVLNFTIETRNVNEKIR